MTSYKISLEKPRGVSTHLPPSRLTIQPKPPLGCVSWKPWEGHDPRGFSAGVPSRCHPSMWLESAGVQGHSGFSEGAFDFTCKGIPTG